MNEKPVAALVAALAIAPICAVCILGPAFVGSVLASIFGWFKDRELTALSRTFDLLLGPHSQSPSQQDNKDQGSANVLSTMA